ncbi:MAG: hypothetical protein NT173_13315 [Opitutales bacterium]|nr:hypothetical protein [Opitutales bacterium]
MSLRLPLLSLAAWAALSTAATAAPVPAAPTVPAAAAAPAVVPAPVSPPVTAAQLKGLAARAIGPAVMGGRISDLAIDPHHPGVFYVGYATSGVWKSTNHGVTLAPIFDDQPAQSIGAVAVAPSDSEVVWVGTGEGNDRNSSGWGVGLFKSTDGGGQWAYAGLKDSRTIRRILIHPKNPDIVFAAAGGSLWAEGGERGLYRTTDGGRSWQLVLGAPAPHDALTGCADVAMDPANPDLLYAALYARQRKPWAFLYGVNATRDAADVGGIFKSTDGGTTWTRLTNHLPARMGRIGLAVAPGKPGTVMALVQSDEGGTSDIDQNHSRSGGVFRSEDAGATWTRVNSFNPRPFYFSRLAIDPANDRRVYVIAWHVYVSDDAGQTFREDRSGNVHSDVHAIVIQPGSVPPPPAKPAAQPVPPVSAHLLIGTDGGLYQTFDAGENWQFLNSVPSGQYYRIALDHGTPYRIAGGLQDNTNWVGPSRTFTKEGIRNSDWTMIGGGDGFYTVFDPADKDVIFAESQGGSVHRFNARTGEMRDFQPKPTEGSQAFRFQWCAPLIGSAHAPDVLYLGGNRVFKLTHHGETFEIISPDLSYNERDKTTTVGSTAENYAVVYALAESPLQAGRLFAGTDDGRLWVTSDEGRQWTRLRRVHRLPRRRRHALCLPVHPARGRVDARDRRPARGASGHRAARGPRQPERPLPRHRVRPLHLAQRRPELGEVRRAARRARGRHPDPPARGRHRRRHPRPLALRVRRQPRAARVHARGRRAGRAPLQHPARARPPAAAGLDRLRRHRLLRGQESPRGRAAHRVGEGVHGREVQGRHRRRDRPRGRQVRAGRRARLHPAQLGPAPAEGVPLRLHGGRSRPLRAAGRIHRHLQPAGHPGEADLPGHRRGGPALLRHLPALTAAPAHLTGPIRSPSRR